MTSSSPPLPRIAPGAPSLVLAEAVARVVNAVYDATEGAVWSDGVQRTSTTQALELLEAGALLTAQAPEATPEDPALLGAVCVTLRDPSTAEFGMLAVDPAAAGRGLGSALVRAAEQHASTAGARRMEIVVLRPVDGTLPAKEILGRWYPRLGYTLTGTAPVTREALPTLDLLLTPCLLDTYVRGLTGLAPTAKEHL